MLINVIYAIKINIRNILGSSMKKINISVKYSVVILTGLLLSGCGGSSPSKHEGVDPVKNIMAAVKKPSVFGVNHTTPVTVILSNKVQKLATAATMNQTFAVSVMDANTGSPIVCSPASIQASVDSPVTFQCLLSKNTSVNSATKKLQAVSESKHTLQVLVGDQQEDLDDEDVDVDDFEVHPSISPALLSNIMPNKDYPVTFTFTNNNTTYSITGIDVSQAPSGFTETQNTCHDDIPANDSCQISGTFKASDLGPVSLAYTLDYDQGDGVTSKTESTVSQVSVSGKVTTALHPSILKNKSYPLVYTFMNESAVPALNLSLSDVPEGFSVTSNTCKDQIAANSSCQITGTFEASENGSVNPTYTLKYLGGADVQLSSPSIVNDMDMKGSVFPALPANIEQKTDHDVMFTFTNSGDIDATGVKVSKPTSDDFTEKSNSCGTILAAHTSCNIMGTFNTAESGPLSLGYIFSYAEGVPITTTTNTMVTDQAIVGKIETPFEPSVAVSTDNSVVFSFTNTSARDIEGIKIIKPSNVDGYTETKNTCTGSMAPNASCEIDGTLNTEKVGPVEIDYKLQYPYGKDVSLTAKTDVSRVVIEGETITSLPTNIEIGNKPQVAFKFTNTSQLDATNLAMTEHPSDLDYKEDKNTCNGISELAAGESCEITGTLIPTTAPKDVVLPYTLSYGKDQKISVSTESHVTDVAMNGEITQGFPSDGIENGQTYSLAFKYTNTNIEQSASNQDQPATGIKITNAPANFKETVNTCKTMASIKDGAFCTIEGEYTAPKEDTSAIDVGYTLTYDQGKAVTLDAKTSSSETSITGKVSPDLPKVLMRGKSYLVTFTFNNLGKYAAHDISISATPENFHENENTCTSGEIAANGGSCVVSGEFITPSSGTEAFLTYTLKYNDDKSSTLKSTTGQLQASAYAFILNYSPKKILEPKKQILSRCDVDEAGDVSNCVNTGIDLSGFEDPNAVTVNPQHTKIVIVGQKKNSVKQCDLSPLGEVSQCQDITIPSTQSIRSMLFNAQTNQAYFLDNQQELAIACDVDASGDFQNCGDQGASAGIHAPQAFALNADGNGIYMLGSQSYAAHYDISRAGVFSNYSQITDALMPSAGSSIQFNSAGTRAFILKFNNNQQVLSCAVDVKDGAFSDCALEATNIAYANDMSLNAAGSQVFLVSPLESSENPTLAHCDVDVDGKFSHCVDTHVSHINEASQITIISTE